MKRLNKIITWYIPGDLDWYCWKWDKTLLRIENNMLYLRTIQFGIKNFRPEIYWHIQFGIKKFRPEIYWQIYWTQRYYFNITKAISSNQGK